MSSARGRVGARKALRAASLRLPLLEPQAPGQLSLLEEYALSGMLLAAAEATGDPAIVSHCESVQTKLLSHIRSEESGVEWHAVNDAEFVHESVRSVEDCASLEEPS